MIELGPMAVRFWGVAAPEWDALGGQEATDAIKALVLDKEVRCELTGKRTYDRCVGICYLDGLNGEANWCGSGGRYGDLEQAAVDQGATIRERYRLPEYCAG